MVADTMDMIITSGAAAAAAAANRTSNHPAVVSNYIVAADRQAQRNALQKSVVSGR
jgi:hypothetical protein